MKLREDLKQLRAESLAQMKTHCQLMQGTEEQIYQEGSKLKKVMEENHRFQEVSGESPTCPSYKPMFVNTIPRLMSCKCDLYDLTLSCIKTFHNPVKPN